jgi:hypothetical protein
MKNLISKKEKDQIDLICSQYSIEDYTINSDGSIDVDGDVALQEEELSVIPLKFGKVTGNFNCLGNYLTSLDGCPVTVGGDFGCGYNGLTSLDGAPHSVGGDFYCNYNDLTSTYSGDTDIEISGIVRCADNSLLPQQLLDNLDHIKIIIKYQRHFYIWNDDLSLNIDNFTNLIEEINDGLE